MSLFPVFAPVAKDPVTVSFAGEVNTGTNATAFTFSGAAVGTATADRKVVVCAGSDGGSTGTISGVTVGGEACTEIVTSGISTEIIEEIWTLDDFETGTTADIIVTYTASKGRCSIGVYAVTGAASAAHDTGSSLLNPGVDTIGIPANGAAISSYFITVNRTNTWTNLDEDYDVTVEGSQHTGASKAFAAADASLTITATPASTTTHEAMAMASWAPA